MIRISSSDLKTELAKHGKLWYTFFGVSMRPLLRSGKDLICVIPCEGKLQKYDVPLYVRKDGRYVLHRIIKVEKGEYLIRGDNTFSLERVPEEQIFGVLAAVKRNGNVISVTDTRYKLYVRVHNAVYPVRWGIFKIRRFLGTIKRGLKQ